VADKEKQFGRLVDHVINEVCQHQRDKHDPADARDPDCERRFRKL
jgi:hypothetical protein